MNERGVTKISEPFFKSKLFKATSNATVPFDSATAYLVLLKFANSFSKVVPAYQISNLFYLI